MRRIGTVAICFPSLCTSSVPELSAIVVSPCNSGASRTLAVDVASHSTMVYLCTELNKYTMKDQVGIVGFRGYSGAELLRILHSHPHAEPVLMEHRSDSGFHPVPRGSKRPKAIPCTPQAVRDEGLKAV